MHPRPQNAERLVTHVGGLGGTRRWSAGANNKYKEDNDDYGGFADNLT